jgi:hypothetical protein
VACRKAIRQRAIIVGFKLAKIKTDTTRFIAHCGHETCKWRIHASVLQDGKTAMVWVVFIPAIYLQDSLLYFTYVDVFSSADKNTPISAQLSNTEVVKLQNGFSGMDC